MEHTVLVVDDNEDIFRSLRINFAEFDWQTLWVKDGAGALAEVARDEIDIVLLDLSLGDENGINVLEDIQRIRPGLPVVIITGFGTFEVAVRAVKLGAFDFLPKPLDFDKLLAIVQNAIHMAGPGAAPGISEPSNLLLSRNAQVASLCSRAGRLAATDIPILITGESGTGKELLAEHIHRNSTRRDKPFVQINCSALTDSLVNAELFGHEKGAFTGAGDRHIGIFEQASGGTLHLDEIGDMGISNQAKILRILEERKLRRIGGMKDIPVDVRIVASTNKNLEDLIEMGAFRQDLLFRLNSVLLYLPPLRERQEDLELLAKHFLKEYAVGDEPKTFSPEAWANLQAHSWPGNVRELRNLIKVCSAVTDSPVIGVRDLPVEFSCPASKSGRLNELERDAIVKALVDAAGNKSQAAGCLGITRRTLYKKMERYGIKS